MWTAKSSSSGFSVSLAFWCCDWEGEAKKEEKVQEAPKASTANTVTDVATSPTSPASASGFNGHSDVTPNKAQSNKDANHDSKPQITSPLVWSISNYSWNIYKCHWIRLCMSWKLTFCCVITLAMRRSKVIFMETATNNKHGWTPCSSW